MVVNIDSTEDQKLLGRKLVKGSASFDGATPKRLELRKQIAKELKAKDEQVFVRRIYTDYGKQSARIEATVYDKPEDAKALETKGLLKRHEKQPKKEAPKKEAPAEKPAEAAPKEAPADDKAPAESKEDKKE